MTDPLKVELTVEEGIEFQRFDAMAEGYALGVQQTVNHFRRLKLQEIIASRSKKATPENQNN